MLPGRNAQIDFPSGSSSSEVSNHYGLPQWLSGEESACNTGNPGDMGLIPGLGRSPGEGHGNPPQYSCLENGEKSLAGYSPPGYKELDMTEQLTLSPSSDLEK